MKITRARISNFKSIGTSENVIELASMVTAIVGKNESGKSNILESLGKMNTLTSLPNDYSRCMTRDQAQQPVVELTLEFTEQDKVTLQKELGSSSSVFTYRIGSVAIEGSFADLLTADDELMAIIASIGSFPSGTLGLQQGELSVFNACIGSIKSIPTKLFENYSQRLTTTKANASRRTVANGDTLIANVDRLIEILNRYYTLIPQIYFRTTNSILSDNYTSKDIKETHLKKAGIFRSLLTAAGINDSTIIDAFEKPTDGDKRTAQRKFDKAIQDGVVAKFNEFYKQEEIKMDISFDAQSIKFFILTEDKAMSFSERSNGLKWFFSLYIDVLAKIDPDRPTFYLLDEPGVYLHVNAQRGLLELFDELCRQGGQVLYSTHSPSMLKTEDTSNVRAVQKSLDGMSHIFNSIYHPGLDGDKASKLETLSPLINFIGMEMKYNLSPLSGKKNLIVEGYTDYLYITAMLNYLNIAEDKRPAIIPSSGVDNIIHIASILSGWGCEFSILVDFDGHGYQAAINIQKKLKRNWGEDIFFVSSTLPAKKSDVDGPNAMTIESLVSASDFSKLTNDYSQDGSLKSLSAKEFAEKVKSGTITLSDTTIANFTNLFFALHIVERETNVPLSSYEDPN